MIAFGCAVTAPEIYDRRARPGIERSAEADSVIDPLRATSSIFRSYNILLERAALHEDLEALVLLHQDTELTDPGFCTHVREALRDPRVGVAGAIGAIGVRSLAWWEGSVTWASFTHRYSELGGGDLPGFSRVDVEPPAFARTGEVDVADGFLLVLAPWVVRELRFDESLGALHGYDVDFCLQVREAGGAVVTAPFDAIHHHSLELVSDLAGWTEAHMRLAAKWDGRMPGMGRAGGTWEQRARRAEAEAEAARAGARQAELRHQAELRARDLEVEVMATSVGWRLTEPLRRANHLRRRARARLDARGRG